MQLSKFITERLKITSKTKSLRLIPETRDELYSLIETELKQQGPDADLNHIDTSKIDNMNNLFNWLEIGNIKFDNWDTSKVTTMQNMFVDQENFRGDGIEHWNVSNVKHMSYMFHGCKQFNADLSDWDVSNATHMRAMFDECTKFKGTGLENWDISKVDDTAYMFHNCKNLNSGLSGWNVSNVTDMEGMFLGCWKFKQDLSGWNVGRVRTHKNFFGKKNIMTDDLQPKFKN